MSLSAYAHIYTYNDINRHIHSHDEIYPSLTHSLGRVRITLYLHFKRDLAFAWILHTPILACYSTSSALFASVTLIYEMIVADELISALFLWNYYRVLQYTIENCLSHGPWDVLCISSIIYLYTFHIHVYTCVFPYTNKDMNFLSLEFHTYLSTYVDAFLFACIQSFPTIYIREPPCHSPQSCSHKMVLWEDAHFFGPEIIPVSYTGPLMLPCDIIVTLR